MPLLLTRQDVEALLTMRATINTVETALRERAQGDVAMSQRTVLRIPKGDGVPLAVMDATFLAAMRTGATSAVATKYLARREVNEVTVYGAGRQANIQLMGVCAVRQVNVAVVVEPDTQARQRGVGTMVSL